MTSFLDTHPLKTSYDERIKKNESGFPTVKNGMGKQNRPRAD